MLSLKHADVVWREEDGCKVVPGLSVWHGHAELKEVVVGEVYQAVLVGCVQFDDDLEVGGLVKRLRREEQSLVSKGLSVAWTDVFDEIDDGLFDGPAVVVSGDHRSKTSALWDAGSAGVVLSLDAQVSVDDDPLVAQDVALQGCCSEDGERGCDDGEGLSDVGLFEEMPDRSVVIVVDPKFFVDEEQRSRYLKDSGDLLDDSCDGRV